MTADGNIPVAFRCTDGNASDSRTHIETWNTLRAVAGRSDFLYVADSKLCSRENTDYIDRAGGRFVTVMQALIERELRLAMKREHIDELPLYPEQRQCRRPTTEQILRLFSLAERHQLIEGAHTVQVFDVPLTGLQHQVLTLLGVSENVFRSPG